MLQDMGAFIREIYPLFQQHKQFPDNPLFKDSGSEFFKLLGDKTKRPFQVDLSSDWNSPDPPWEWLEIDKSASIEEILEAFYQKFYEFENLWNKGCTGERPCNGCECYSTEYCDVEGCHLDCGKCEYCTTFYDWLIVTACMPDLGDFSSVDLLQKACDFMISSILDKLQMDDVQLKIPIDNLLYYKPPADNLETLKNAMIFIDGQNLGTTFVSQYGVRARPEEVIKIIERELGEQIPGSKILRIHYFDCARNERHKGFLGAIKHIPRLKVHEIGEYLGEDGEQSTNIDPFLIDCVLESVKDYNLSIIVLVTGDGKDNYLNLVSKLHDKKLQVAVAFPLRSTSLSAHLKNAVDIEIDLTELTEIDKVKKV